MGKKQKKTNVMRILDQKKIPYTAKEYPHEEGELDLKKAAKAVGEKNVAMLHVAELLPLTGYVRGGCSPVGMKKPFFTTFHESATQYDVIAVSAGKIGEQVILSPQALCDLVGGQFADVIK